MGGHAFLAIAVVWLMVASGLAMGLGSLSKGGQSSPATASSGQSTASITGGRTGLTHPGSLPITVSIPSQVIERVGPQTSAGVTSVVTQNWGGYVFCPSGPSNCKTYPSGEPVTKVTGQWKIPQIVATPDIATSGQDEAAVNWVGIGGSGGDQTLIQAGTEEGIGNGNGLTEGISAWWEMIPAGQQTVTLQPNSVISAGDSITVIVTYLGTSSGNQVWSFTISDTTTSSSWSSSETCGPTCYPSTFGGAEWIQENPQECVNGVSNCWFEQIPAYSDVQFSDAAVTFGSITSYLGSLPSGDLEEDFLQNTAYSNAYGVVPSNIYGTGASSTFVAQYLVDPWDPFEEGQGSMAPSIAGVGSTFDSELGMYSPDSFSQSAATGLWVNTNLVNPQTDLSVCDDLSDALLVTPVSQGLQYYTSQMSVCNGVPPGYYWAELDLWFAGTYNGVATDLPLWQTTATLIQVVSTYQSTYAIIFTESGLPNGQSWSVTIGGSTLSSTVSTIVFFEGDGTYSYSVTVPAGYTGYGGSVTINGAAFIVPIAIVLNTPTGLKETSATTTSVTMGWTNPRTSTITGAEVYQATYTTSCQSFSPVMAASSPYTSATVTGLSPGSEYCFAVQAADSAGTSLISASALMETLTAAPTGLAAGYATSTTIPLSWTAPATSPSSGVISSYTVLQATYSGGSCGSYSTSHSTGSSATSYTVSGLTLGTTYCFEVAAVDMGGTSADSSAIVKATALTYTVTFTESKAPSGYQWGVYFNGGWNYQTTPTSIVISVQDGTWGFSVSVVDEICNKVACTWYQPSPSSGSLTVNGKAVTQPITYSPDKKVNNPAVPLPLRDASEQIGEQSRGEFSVPQPPVAASVLRNW